MLLLAEMPAVVAPEHDPRIGRRVTLIKRVEQATDFVVHVGGTGQVRLHRGPPLFVLKHRGMAAGSDGFNGPLTARGANILQVVSAHGRQLAGVLLEPFEIFLWREERDVRPIITHAEKERFLFHQTSLQFPDCPSGDLRVAEVAIRHVEPTPVEGFACDRVGLAVGRHPIEGQHHFPPKAVLQHVPWIIRPLTG